MKPTLARLLPVVVLGLAALSFGGGACKPGAPGGGPPERAGAFVPDGNMERSRIPDQYKWKLAPLFPGDEAFEQGLAAVAASRERLGAFKGRLSQPKELLAAFDLYFQTRLLTNKLTLYASLRFDSDKKSTQLQAMHERSLKAMDDLMATASFIRQEVLSLDEEALKSAYASEARLGEYRPYLEELRRRKARVLNPAAERVLSLAGDNLWAEIDLNELPSDFEKAFKGLLSDIPLPRIRDESGREVQLTLSNYNKLRASSDRRVRRDTVESFFATLKQYQHVFAGALAGQIRFNLFLARARGYDTALEAYLDKDQLEPAVYRNLVRSINANLRPLHRYLALRKKIMGLSELHLYDLYSPLVRAVRMEFPYEQALRLLPAALAPLGDAYLGFLRSGLDPQSGWIDVYPHRNKESGAFSSSVFGVHPFVKMNYFDELNDLSTLAHELGHAVHSHLSMTHQPYVTSNYPPFLAEIASTMNEKLLSDHLVANAKSDAEKLFVLNEMVNTIRTTIYRQTLFAEFELEAHTAAEKGTPLTAELLNGIYERLVRTYYGPELVVGVNDGIEWAYIPHFYYKYYVFSYATGLSSGIALAERVQRGGPQARDAYLGMLKGGASRPPLELLRSAGVDLTTPQVIEAAARVMDRTLDEMEKILEPSKR
jgi:oligoendopeptidase F